MPVSVGVQLRPGMRGAPGMPPALERGRGLLSAQEKGCQPGPVPGEGLPEPERGPQSCLFLSRNVLCPLLPSAPGPRPPNPPHSPSPLGKDPALRVLQEPSSLQRHMGLNQGDKVPQ